MAIFQSIFGGDTGETLKSITDRRATRESNKRKRAIIAAMEGRQGGTPRNIGEGLTAIGNALALRSHRKSLKADEAAVNERGAAAWADLLGGTGIVQDTPPTGTPFDEKIPSSGPQGADPIAEALLGRAQQARAGAGPGVPGQAVQPPTDADFGQVPPTDQLAANGNQLPPDHPAATMADLELLNAGAQGAQPQIQPQQVAQQPPPPPQQPQGIQSLADIPLPMLLQAAQNPDLNQQQRGIVNMLLQQRLKTANPLDALRAQKLEAEVNNLKNPRGTSQMQNFLFGKENPDFAAQQERLRRAGATNVTVGGNKYGPIPKGHQLIDGPEGARIEAIPGSPAAVETQTNRDIDVSNAQDAVKIIDEALAHPGLDESIGLVQGRMGAVTNNMADFIALHDQIAGKTFLQAYQTLKGGGQITEVEGKKAEAAIARLNRVQSEGSYRKALQDLRDVIEQGVARAGAGTGAPKRRKFNTETGELE